MSLATGPGRPRTRPERVRADKAYASQKNRAYLRRRGIRGTIPNNQYQPTMMHAKVVTVDHVVGLVGSTNFNRRSLDHDEEVMLAVLDEAFTATLDEHFEADVAVSELIRTGRWGSRSLMQRAREAAIAPIRRFL